MALVLAAIATTVAAFVLPHQEGRRAPAGWLDDLCPPAQVEAVA